MSQLTNAPRKRPVTHGQECKCIERERGAVVTDKVGVAASSLLPLHPVAFYQFIDCYLTA